MTLRFRSSFLITLLATIFFGLAFLGAIFSVIDLVNAADVSIEGEVASTVACSNGIREGSETCDGNDGASSCYNNTCTSSCTCPVCGNGTVEAGENCENDSQCSNGRTCNSQCLCVGGVTCVPGACTPVSWSGVCTNGVEYGSGSNGCGACGVSRACGAPFCGDGNVDTGLGEVCDDGNQTSGDCCSSSCAVEVVISNVQATPTNNSAIISWNTSCGSSTSVLEWGKTAALGSAVTLGPASTFSYTLNSLDTATVYFFKITAQNSNGSDTHTGSFSTLGAQENCSNGVDDDNDGLIDLLDTDCPCQAEWECTPSDWNEVECVNNQQVRDCQKVNTCWNNQPLPQEVRGCNSCQGVTCSPGQQLDPQSCACVTAPPQCGNGVCEPPSEDPTTCFVDCPVSCISEWECTPWEPEQCPANGIQFRNCFDRKACPTPINPPPVQQSCGGICEGLTCDPGEQMNTDLCICEAIVPYCGNGVCETGETPQNCSQDCIPLCAPAWNCTAWSVCDAGIQRRSCNDSNSCNLNLDRPPEVRACTQTCQIACSNHQRLDLGSCTCQEIIPFCGNQICEENEKTWSCPVDCGLPPEFRIAVSRCLDGIDNDGDGLLDYPQDPGCSGPADNNEQNLEEVIANIEEFIEKQVLDNPVIELANERVVAPAAAITVAASAATSFSLFNILAYLRYLFTQPVMGLFIRKRKKWGIVYNSLTKQPVDLAIVRLYRADDGTLVQSRVTDKNGRYAFLVDPGKYRLTVTKPKFSFPSQYLNGQDKDIKYLDLYHGSVMEATKENPDIIFNIPVDPEVQDKPSGKILLGHYLRKLQEVVAFSAVPIAAFSAVISPTPMMFGLLALHVVLYLLFRRLAYRRKPKSWGKVYSRDNRQPLSRAITRIYDKKYNKLLETKVTDSRGRYSFLVDNNLYYVTAEKLGFKQFKSDEINLIDGKREAMVGLDIPLDKHQASQAIDPREMEASALAKLKTTDSTTSQEQDQLAEQRDESQSGVDRETLQALAKQKHGDTYAEQKTSGASKFETVFNNAYGEAVVAPETLAKSPTGDGPKTEGDGINKNIYG